LGHEPDPACLSVAELWQWARAHWQLARVAPAPVVA
jgi:glutamyl-Q tRNA(Asp) synthetase